MVRDQEDGRRRRAASSARRSTTLGTPVVVIGQDVADHFFPSLEPIGRELQDPGHSVHVIGVAEKQGSVFGMSIDKFLIAPDRSPLNRWVNPHGVVDQVIVQAQSDNGMREAMEATRAVMRARHHLHPSQPDNFALETSDSALEFWNKIQSYLDDRRHRAADRRPRRRRDRHHEHHAGRGRRAHARDRHSEVARRAPARHPESVPGRVGDAGTLGAALGVRSASRSRSCIAAVSPLPAAVEIWSIFVGVGVGAGVGMIAGIYPASRAALLDPIAAMRQET